MLLVVVFAVQLLAPGLGVHAHDNCTEQVDYITSKKVEGRPSILDCESKIECHIRFNIRRFWKQKDSEWKWVYQVNGESDQGPTIIANNGTLIVVDVFNYMLEDTSIHWHGMHQVNFPWMDGVGLITQKPIKPRWAWWWPWGPGKFRYIFRARPPGTHWYHSHTRKQRETGLVGALIIREDDKYKPPAYIKDCPENQTLVIQAVTSDMSPKEKASGEIKYCLPDGSQVPFQFDTISLRLNGKPLAKKAKGTSESPALQFFVERGKSYRFRIISAMSGQLYAISIGGHKMHVIATDGYLVKNFTTDYLIMHVSERYDVVVEATVPIDKGTFPIRIQTLAELCGSNGDLAGEGYAFLVYREPNSNSISGERSLYMTDPSPGTKFTILNCPMRNLPDNYLGQGITTECHNVRSLQLKYPTEPTKVPSDDNPKTEFFDFFTHNISGINFFTINGIKFENPKKPLVDNTKTETENCRYPMTCNEPGEKYCTHAIYFDDGIQRFVFSSHGGDNVEENLEAGRTHPIHMHGHSYFVAKIGYPDYNLNGTIKKLNNDLTVPHCGAGNWTDHTAPDDISVNSTTVRKDVVIVPAGGYVVVQFFADSPGYWFMHCHIDHHLENGMAIALGENIDCARDLPANGPANWLCIEEYKELERTVPNDDPKCRGEPTEEKLSKYGYAARMRHQQQQRKIHIKYDLEVDF